MTFLPISKTTTKIQIAILIAITAIVFWSVIDGSILLWDDRQLLLDDQNLKSLTFENFAALWGRVHNMLYIPAVQSMWFLNGLVFGQWSSEALHAMNLVFHIANTVMVYFLQRKLIPFGRDDFGKVAMLVTLVFALHPTRVEAVAWIAGFKEVLAATFGLVSILLYLSTRESEKHWLARRAASLVLFGLSLSAKPSFVILPLCLLVLEWRPRLSLKDTAMRLAPYVALAIAITTMTVVSQEPHRLLYVPQWWGRLLVAADSIGFYLVKTLVPLVKPDYGRMPGLVDSDFNVWLVPVAVMLIWTLAIAITRSRDLIRSYLLFVVSLAPVLGLIPFYYQQTSTVADRYLYFPAVWFSLLLALGITSLAPGSWRRKTAVAMTYGLIFVSMVITFRTIPKWKDDRTFFSWMLEENPKSFTAINRLADLEREAGRYQNALDLYQASRQVAPWQPYPWLYSAYMQYQLGRKDESIATLKALLAQYPGYEPAEENLKRLLQER